MTNPRICFGLQYNCCFPIRNSEPEVGAMGMDLTGLKPTAEIGVYFRNPDVCWSPLWDYVASTCSDILTRTDVKLGSFNMGHRISRAKALRISERLQTELKSGSTAKYSSRIRKRLSKPRPRTAAQVALMVASALNVNSRVRFNVSNVRKFAEFCGASGGFVID